MEVQDAALLSSSGDIAVVVEKKETSPSTTNEITELTEKKNGSDTPAAEKINSLDESTPSVTEKLKSTVADKPAENAEPTSTEAKADEEQDDDLIRELEKFEDVKKVDESAPSTTVSNGTKSTENEAQQTSDLLKDLESDSSGGAVVNPILETVKSSDNDVKIGKPESSSNEVIENNKDDEKVESNIDESDNVQVDSTTENSLKRKHSEENLLENVAKKPNHQNDAEVEEATTSLVKNIVSEPAETVKSEDKPAAEEASVNKNEIEAGISSTSTEEKLEILKEEENVAAESAVKESEEAKKENKIEEVVTSTDDKKSEEPVSVSQADSSAAEIKKDNVKNLLSDSTVSLNSTNADVTMEELGATEHDKTADNGKLEKMDEDLNESLDDQSTIKLPAQIQNKLLTNMMNNGSSTPNSNNPSAAATPNVFNSTPIEKQFEISSGNVSKISETGGDSHVEKTLPSDENFSTEQNVTTDDLTKSTTGSESEATQSSDNLVRYTNVLTKYNGLAGVVSAEEENQHSDGSKLKLDSTDTKKADGTSSFISITNGSPLTEAKLQENVYEISVWYEESELKFLTVEKMENGKSKVGASLSTYLTDLTHTTDDKTSSSNGSVGSVGPFTLPEKSATTSAALSQSSSTSLSDSHKTVDGKSSISLLPQQRTKHTINGVVEMCNFMIDHFSEIRKTYSNDTGSYDAGTPVAARGKGGVKKNLSKSDTASPDVQQTPSKSGKRGAGKRALDKNSSDTEEEPKAKQTKQVAKKGGAKAAAENDDEEEPAGDSVLARWVDKKYYAGRVTEEKAGNKFVVLFEDGASKVLPHDYIVFGTDDVLPLLDQSVHALVEADTYEPGLVTLIEKKDDTVLYTVVAESKTVTVTSSDIYLEDDQAKMIQSSIKGTDALLKSPDAPTPKRAGRPPAKLDESITGRTGGRGKKSSAANTPEPGFSGNVSGSGKRGLRANKRPEPPTRFSESSDISDTVEEELSAPNSPDSAIEAIDGVQPELQRTPKESEINKLTLIAEYLGNDRSKNIEELLGPLPENKKLFRNKHFLLTCTIPTKAARRTDACSTNGGDDIYSSHPTSNGIDLTVRNIKFSSLPFLKEHLSRQIVCGGGTVYTHFEDVPKGKYKQCKLIAPHPCATAKYVQCLAANISAVSHEWIIQCCQTSTLLDAKAYSLPAGWSIIDERYKKWQVGKSISNRSSATALANNIVLLASQQKEFIEFWTRVCKLSGATIRYIKKVSDITPTTKGYMLTDEEFPEEIKLKADYFKIPIVSTVWVVQSLIMGDVCSPDSHEKLTQIYEDDDY